MFLDLLLGFGLQMNARYLALHFQTLLVRLTCDTDADNVASATARVLTEWQAFLTSLSSSDASFEVSLEYMAFKLFLFYYLGPEQRQAVLERVYELLIGAKEAGQPVLLVARLLVICDYLIQHPEKPTPPLLKLVNASLFSLSIPPDVSDLFSSKLTISQNHFKVLI